MLGKITNSAKAFVNKLDTVKQRNLLSIIFVLIVLPLLIISSQQVQNIIQRASTNGGVQITLDGKEIENNETVTKTFVKLKATQPTGWQVASIPTQKEYSLIQQANAQAACPKTPGEPGLTTTYGTETYDSCVDNTGGSNTNNTLCTDPSATKFRCYFWQNPTGCISGANENDFNYYCPAKQSAPTATPIPTQTPVPAQNSPVPCPQAGQPGADTVNFGTTTYDTCVDNKDGVKDSTFNTLCTDPAAIKFRCFYSKNPTYCLSGKGTYDFNYLCPGKQASAKCVSLTAKQNTIKTGEPLIVIPNFTGQVADIQFAIGDTIDVGFQNIKKIQNPISGNEVTITNTQNFTQGTKYIGMTLGDGRIPLDGSNNRCKGTFTVSGSAVTPSTTAPTIQPTTPTVHNLQKIIIENIDGGTQGSPKYEFDKNSDAGRTMIAQLLSGTLDWQLNPYANSNQRKVKITFVDQTGINQVSTEITVIMKASVKILNADNSLPQNNKTSNARVKLVINGTDLLANNKTSPLSFPKAYAAECTLGQKDLKCEPQYDYYCRAINKSNIEIGATLTRTCMQNGTWGAWETWDNSSKTCLSMCGSTPTSTPTPRPSSTPTPSPTSTQASQTKDCNYRDMYNTCVPITTEKCSNNPAKREAFLYMCNEKGQLIQYGYDCIDVGSCSNNITTTPLNQSSPTPTRRATVVPNVPNIPRGNGSDTPSCPQSGDNCIYSESDGRCFSGKNPNVIDGGFNVPGCNFSCGPITCPSADDGDDLPPLPPVDEPPADAGGSQPRTADAPKVSTIVIRNADSGAGGSEQREVPLTAGDITIDDWILNTAGSSNLRTVQAIFKNANGETMNVVNAFVTL